MRQALDPTPRRSVCSVNSVADAIVASWTAETSVDPQAWTSAIASRGQCAVTALVVQDLLGGTLLRGEVHGASHYWIRLPSGEEIDLTRDQFARFHLDGPVEERTREYVLSHPDTALRYRLLKARVMARLEAAL